MQITETSWSKYIEKLSGISQTAADKMQKYIDLHGTEDRKALIEYANALIAHYGEASGSLSCQMYEELASVQGITVPTAEPAELPTYGETAKAINGTLKQSAASLPGTVSRLVKQSGADTTLKNAIRDGAEAAWVPHGDTCAFCITLASRGWERISKKTLKNGHAEHIHAHCDCEYAVRFDGKSTVEGYDPDKYLEMYENAEGVTPEEKINSLRRHLSQHKKTSKVKITDQAIAKVNKVAPHGYSEEKARELQQMNKELLKKAKSDNNSDEVAMMYIDGIGVSDAFLGVEDSVEIGSNPDLSHTLRNSAMRSIDISHNHPSLSYFSIDDIGVFMTYPSIKTMYVITNQGKVSYISKKDRYDDLDVIEGYRAIVKSNMGKNMDEIVDIFLKEYHNVIERSKW